MFDVFVCCLQVKRENLSILVAALVCRVTIGNTRPEPSAPASDNVSRYVFHMAALTLKLLGTFTVILIKKFITLMMMMMVIYLSSQPISGLSLCLSLWPCLASLYSSKTNSLQFTDLPGLSVCLCRSVFLALPSVSLLLYNHLSS